jgi:hypothetical protein
LLELRLYFGIVPAVWKNKVCRLFSQVIH